MNSPVAPPTRRYDLDWIRVGAFGLLILYHVGLVYGVYDWHVHSAHTFAWMRAAILITKAAAENVELPEEVAFFMAQRIRSNVRELEGALRRVMANSSFTGRAIDLEFARDALRDLLALQERLVTIENIQKTVAEYFKIRVADVLSHRRSRSVARPRQMAMSLAKELTRHSLPEIGDAFGGRDHTTVLHACRRIQELRGSDTRVREDYQNLLRTLTG